MKVTRRRGTVRLVLEPVESEILNGLFNELGTAYDGLAPDDVVYRRLFPDGHRDDGLVAAEFRELTESTLRNERVERLGQCRADIAGSPETIGLGPDESRRWLQVVNDLRLAIGTRLGVTQDRQEVRPDSPDAQAWALYGWLSLLQETIVDAVSE